MLQRIQKRGLYCLVYNYVEGMLEKRAPYREKHLQILQELHSQNKFKLAAVLAEPADTALLVFNETKDAEQFIKDDPYYQNGLVTRYQIRPLMVAIGDFK